MRVRASLVATIGLIGCASAPARPLHDAEGSFAAHYTVHLEEGDWLAVEIEAHDESFMELSAEGGTEPFIVQVEAGPRGGKLVPVDSSKWPLSIPACKSGCTVRYRFDLDAAAAKFDDPSYAQRRGKSVLAPSPTWLLRPTKVSQAPFDLDVKTPPGRGFVSGMRRNGRGVYEAHLDDLPQAPYAAFGPYASRVIRLGDRTIDLVRVGPEPAIGDDAIEAWTSHAAEDLATYYDKFVPERALVLVLVDEGRAVSEGTALGNGGASIMVHVGKEVAQETLANDWILTHEMVHLSMPGLAAPHRWLEEGLATYLEPVARARVGRLPIEDVWKEWVSSMRKGQPVDGDGGLDGTDSWGRIYWGGAAFWLLAEVAIAEHTDGEKGLRECLQAVANEGGSIAVRWEVRHFLRSCDGGVGAPIVERIYDSLAQTATPFDLDGLFARLGVRKQETGTLVFDDHAPEARVRKAILAPLRNRTLADTVNTTKM